MADYPFMRLAAFIVENMEDILKQWETFARSIQPGEGALNSVELRDHAEAMLKVIALDLRTPQTDRESVRKSHGEGPKDAKVLTAAERHADERLGAGFSINLLVAEYRALRASVLRLWLGNNTRQTDIDVADMIRFNEAIDQALAESVEKYAQLVSESQDMFLGILGHDLRTPLQSVSVGAAYLVNSQNADKQLIQLGMRMNRSTARMSAMLDDLLDYTKLRIGGGVRISLQQTDLALVSAQVMEECLASYPSRVIRHVTVGDCTGQWDGRRIGQVYQNLIGNALQYGAPKSVIEVAMHGNAEMVEFSIRNEGKPIPEAEQRSLFDPLRRHVSGDTEENPNSKNLGLGLYIAREVVVAHHGTISLTSTEAGGTIFRVVLPKLTGHEAGKMSA
jgi:signal transduction histidine kinase